MATKWIGTVECKWCGHQARAGIEKDGKGQTYRIVCGPIYGGCGIMEQVAFHHPAGEEIGRLLKREEVHSESGRRPDSPRTEPETVFG
jgi:hypothetical protein